MHLIISYSNPFFIWYPFLCVSYVWRNEQMLNINDALSKRETQVEMRGSNIQEVRLGEF